SATKCSPSSDPETRRGYAVGGLHRDQGKAAAGPSRGRSAVRRRSQEMSALPGWDGRIHRSLSRLRRLRETERQDSRLGVRALPVLRSGPGDTSADSPPKDGERYESTGQPAVDEVSLRPASC